MTAEKEFIPTALAVELNGAVEPAMAGPEAEAMFSSFLRDVTLGAVEAGAWSIGHVKAVVECGDAFMSLSSTTDDGNVRAKGNLGEVSSYSMTVNVIVYGPEAEALERMLLAKTSGLPGSLEVEFHRASGCDDPECFDPFCRLDEHTHDPDCGC